MPEKNVGVTNDLTSSEEVVLVKIALNPSLDGEELKDKLEADVTSFNSCVETLVERGYVELLEEGRPVNWRVTELGRLALEKFVNVLKYDVLYARKKGDVGSEVVNRLNRRKLMFERALKACVSREFEEEGGTSES